MIPNPDDTIVALASAPGPGIRGIVRLSGRAVRSILARVLVEIPDWPSAKRTLSPCRLQFPGIHSPLPADLYFSPAPRTYTGQDTAEIHTVACPPLLDAMIATLLNAGARAARPGEFTLRAFLSGKKDLTRAEAVAGAIEAGSPDELQQALAQMAGGVTLPLQGLREDLLNLLADVEAALDFTDEHIEFVGKKEILLRLGKGLAQLMNLERQFESRSVSSRPFRVALVGEPNAGKSSLFNVLAGLPAALVGPAPGTTRDYLTRSVTLDQVHIELIDTAGWQEAENSIEEQAQALGSSQAKGADLLLWCVEANQSQATAPRDGIVGVTMIRVTTKTDLFTSLPPSTSETLVLRSTSVSLVPTSAKTGHGIAKLKEILAERARAFARPALAPSLSRCRNHVEACLKHLRAAHSIVLFDDPGELLALELRLALEQLGEMVGAVYSDDLLDRIFSRFCIGK